MTQVPSPIVILSERVCERVEGPLSFLFATARKFSAVEVGFGSEALARTGKPIFGKEIVEARKIQLSSLPLSSSKGVPPKRRGKIIGVAIILGGAVFGMTGEGELAKLGD